MALNVASLAKPAFLSRNWIGQDSLDYGTLTATENGTLAGRLIDGDPLSLLNDTSAADGTTWTITASLSEKSLTPGKTVNVLVIQNINWKNFQVKYSTDGGSTYGNVFVGGDYELGTANFAGTDLQLALAADVEDITHIQIDVTHVQASYSDKTKFVGGLIAAELDTQMSRGLRDYVQGEIENKRTVILGDGSVSEDFWLRSAQSYIWWKADFEFRAILIAEVKALQAIRAGRKPFLLYPRPGDDQRAIYQCIFVGELSPVLMIPASNGYELPVSVREVRA